MFAYDSISFPVLLWAFPFSLDTGLNPIFDLCKKADVKRVKRIKIYTSQIKNVYKAYRNYKQCIKAYIEPINSYIETIKACMKFEKSRFTLSRLSYKLLISNVINELFLTLFMISAIFLSFLLNKNLLYNLVQN